MNTRLIALHTIMFVATLWAGVAKAQAVLVKDVYPGSSNGVVGSLVAAESTLYFWGRDGIHGNFGQPWRSDGSAAGTQMITEVLGSDGRRLNDGLSVGPLWFFQADDGLAGAAVHRSDGTVAGTSPVSLVYPNLNGALLSYDQASHRGYYFFTARETTISPVPDRLWSSSGGAATMLSSDYYVFDELTPAAERLVFPCYQGRPIVTFKGFCSSNGNNVVALMPWPADLTSVRRVIAVNDRLFFLGTTDAEGQELWVSDLTAPGTRMVKSLLPGAASGLPLHLTELVRVGDRAFFVGPSTTAGRELWVSDGTEANTFQIKDIRPGLQDSGIARMHAAGDRLFFSADDGSSGTEPWISDGTAAGTTLLRDVVPGPGSGITSTYQVSTQLGDRVIFGVTAPLATDPELWITDGRGAGTASLASSTNASFYNQYVLLDGSLYSQGHPTGQNIGDELMRLPLLPDLGMHWCVNPESAIVDLTSSTSRFTLDASQQILDLNVSVDLYHSYLGDVSIALHHVDTGTTAVLKTAGTCSAGKLLDVVFDDQAPQYLAMNCGPTRHTVPADSDHRSVDSLAAFQGESFGGTWELIVTDSAGSDSGTLHNWCITATELTPEIFVDSFE